MLSTEEMAVVILVISKYRAEGKVTGEEKLGKDSKEGGCNIFNNCPTRCDCIRFFTFL